MYWNIEELLKIINEKNVVLYGAGEYAKRLSKVLIQTRIKIDYVVVTGDNLFTLNGINCFRFSDKCSEIKKSDIYIIIAVSEKYKDEIQKLLQQKGIKKYLIASDYEIDENIFFESSSKLNDADWQEKIERYVDICLNAPVIKEENNKIALVVGDYSPRVSKIYHALKNRNQKVTLFITPKTCLRTICEECLADDLIEVPCYELLHYYLLKSNFLAIHLLTYIYHSELDKTIIEHKKLYGKIIYDEYDIFNYYYIPQLFDFKYEKAEMYCMKNTDAICSRGFEDNHLTKLDSNICKKWLHFEDYCDQFADTFFNSEETPLALCYVGGVVVDSDYEKPPVFGHILEFAELCEKNKVFFHVFPSIYNDKKYGIYEEFQKTHSYFFFHRTLSQNELANVISKFDYGICMASSDYKEHNACGYNYGEKTVYAGTNKFFSYLEAGLPIISPIPEKMTENLSNDGICLRWSIDEYDFDYLKKYKNIMKERVIRIRSKYQIDNNIDRLICFYDELVSDSKFTT